MVSPSTMVTASASAGSVLFTHDANSCSWAGFVYVGSVSGYLALKSESHAGTTFLPSSGMAPGTSFLFMRMPEGPSRAFHAGDLTFWNIPLLFLKNQMDHNVRKQPDVSGAIFLDANVSLETRPYALILYGHNMKTGARFGSLRNFENAGFFRDYPFITFDTLYEEGRYVIFSVGIVGTEESDPHYLDFFALKSRRVDERQQAIKVLQDVSIYKNTVDVALDDQILLLVSCVDNDEERRIVAARRIRDGEI